MYLKPDHKCMKLKVIAMKGELDNSKIIAVDSNTPISITNRATRQKITRK